MSRLRRRRQVIVGDSREVLCQLPTDSVDAGLTDPPYELNYGAKAWDRTGIAYAVDLWREVLRVLKPGAHLLAFGAPRTYHRLACAIEDAGFSIRDTIQWWYGTGYPASMTLAEGVGTALKPGYEPVVLARKPPLGTTKSTYQRWGTGGLRVFATPLEENRWPANVILSHSPRCTLVTEKATTPRPAMSFSPHDDAKFDVVHDREVILCADDCPVKTLDATGGDSRFFYVTKPTREERDQGLDLFEPQTGGELTDRQEGSAGLDNPRAGAGRTSGGRNVHPCVKSIELLRYLVKLITPPGGTVLDPFIGSGSTGCAAAEENRPFIGVELSPKYAAIARARTACSQGKPHGNLDPK